MKPNVTRTMHYRSLVTYSRDWSAVNIIPRPAAFVVLLFHTVKIATNGERFEHVVEPIQMNVTTRSVKAIPE